MKTVNEIPAKETSAKTIRKVGDIHSNGKWIWTEYKPGKFDWRVIKKNDKQTFRASKSKLEGGILVETEEQQSVEVEVDANGNFKAEGWKLTETPAPKQFAPKTKREFIQNTESTLTKEQAEYYFDKFGKPFEEVRNRWEYFQGRIGSTSAFFAKYDKFGQPGKEKPLSSHKGSYRPLARCTYYVDGYMGESIRVDILAQSWKEIYDNLSATENQTFVIVKHPHQ